MSAQAFGCLQRNGIGKELTTLASTFKPRSRHQATGDVTPIYYLIERFLEDESIKQQRAMAELLKIAPQLAALIKQATNQQPRSPADPHHRTTKTPRPTRRQRVGIEQE